MVHFNYFLGIKLFCLSRYKAKIFRISLIHYFLKPHKISAYLDNSLLPIQKCHLNVCLNELKFCKVSWNPNSNSCWNFQLSILTNKKVLFLKKNWSVPCTMDSSYFSQKMATWRPNFPHPWLCLFLPAVVTWWADSVQCQ